MRAFALITVTVLCVIALDPVRAQPQCNLAASDVSLAGPKCARAWFDANLRINEIQTVGTAESYKLRPSDAMLTLIKTGGSDEDAQAVNFAEPPIADQLAAGGRSFVFDVAYDPKGGLFKYPAGASMAGDLMSDDYVATMSRPGFKILHIMDIDFNSSCMTLVACLQAVASWSRAHSAHLPIIIALHGNDDATPMPGGTRPIKFDGAAFDALDVEIRSVFKPEEIITPDMVQGSFPTLHEAIEKQGWPKLGEARGKILFVLDDTRQKVALYRGSRHVLEGRAMFIATDEKSPAAAFVTVENPAKDAAAITAHVKAGLMVHTFADADTREARSGNLQRRDWAFASGAQFISTDFLVADARIGKYQVRIPGGHAAQCNVQIQPQRCAGQGIGSARKP